MFSCCNFHSRDPSFGGFFLPFSGAFGTAFSHASWRTDSLSSAKTPC